MKIYSVPSRTNESKKYRVVVEQGYYHCDCEAKGVICAHIRIVKYWRDEVKGNPERCFYTHDTRRLEEHHLHRASERSTSLTVWLTHWVHQKATWDKEFEKHIAHLFYNRAEPKDMECKATVYEVTTRNDVSGDKTLKFSLKSEDIDKANQFEKLESDQLVKIGRGENYFYASLVGTRKSNKKGHANYLLMRFEAAPAELMNVLALQPLPPDYELNVQYDAQASRERDVEALDAAMSKKF